LVGWRRCHLIFLDLLCIDQENATAKAEAIFSLGAFLKSSDSMLVLWDSSWTHRLWCIFELAAFLHSKASQSHDPNLKIRPTILGPCFLIFTLALCFVLVPVSFVRDRDFMVLLAASGVFAFAAFYVCVSALRAYFRSVEDCHLELREFRLEKTQCGCCSMSHVDANGHHIMCDRVIINKCISRWFGSTALFEEEVRTSVVSALSNQLWGQMLSYKQCLIAMIPFLWAAADTSSAESTKFKGGYAPTELVRGAAMWLGVGPLLMFTAMKLSYTFSKKRSNCLEVVVNILIALVVVIELVAILVSEQVFFLIPFLRGGPLNPLDPYGTLWKASAVFGVLYTSLAWICFRYLAPPGSRQSRGSHMDGVKE